MSRHSKPCILRRMGNNPISRNSSLSQLSQFLYEGVIRVGGWFQNSSLTFNEKHPTVLPKSHAFVHTLIMHLHQQHLHAGCQTMLSILRERFWVINARNIIGSLVHKCVVCYRFRRILTEQLMADLPRDGVVPSLLFEKTGVDYCGPLLITQQLLGRSTIKVFIAIFIWFSTKAAHMELVPSSTTDVFISALKRFISRRGKCQIIYSDNATNFVGANRNVNSYISTLFNNIYIMFIWHAAGKASRGNSSHQERYTLEAFGKE